MANIATTAFLNRLKSLYPPRTNVSPGQAVLNNPWYIVAAVTFMSCNQPEAVPAVFQYVLEDLKQTHTERNLSAETAKDESLLLARKFRDSLFKGGLLSGYPRAINGLVALHSAMPEELRDSKILRNTKTTIEEYEQNGKAGFHQIYGETADTVQSLLDGVYPDMGWFSNTIGYGLIYGYTEATSALETSIALVAALISVDTPRQIAWHIDNTRRLGATLDEAKAIRVIAMEAASESGVKWKAGVPEIEERKFSEQ